MMSRWSSTMCLSITTGSSRICRLLSRLPLWISTLTDTQRLQEEALVIQTYSRNLY